jgi:hypothetical protein
MSADVLLLEALSEAWESANWRWFAEGMRRPVLRLAPAASFLGQWQSSTRTLTLEHTFAWTAPWPEVLDVLHHEMAHQYVAEILGVVGETDHGPAFQRVLARFGVVPVGGAAPPDPVLEKVRKLLALAASPNHHEAEAAMKAAHRLMTRHNVDLAAARATSGLAVRHIGPARARHAAWERLLVGILSSHFFVRVVWVPLVDREGVRLARSGRAALKRVHVAECVGTPANLEIAAWVHDFLSETGERLWAAHRARRGLTGDRERQRYLSGLMVGFRQKLEQSVAECREAGLVWVGDPRLDELVGQRHGRLRSRGGLKLVGSDAYHQGKADGREIVLHKPITSTGAGGRLLT